MKIFAKLTKIDAAKRTVFGRAVQEIPDHAGEIFDYATSKAYFEAWSNEIAKATDGKSMGNIRAMHGKVVAGKANQIIFHDDEKAIDVEAKIVDDNEWEKVEQGCYTGFSIGGGYVKKWADDANPKLTRYTGNPNEISIVDLPCGPTSTFTVVKADGTEEMRKFRDPAPAPEKVAQDSLTKMLADGMAGPAAIAAVMVVEKGWSPEMMAQFEAYQGAEKAKADAAAGVARALDLRKALDNPEITNGDLEKLAALHLPADKQKGTVAELLTALDAVAAPRARSYPEAWTEDFRKSVMGDARVTALTDEHFAAFIGAMNKTAEAKVADISAALLKAAGAEDDKFGDPVNKKYPIDTAPRIRAAWSFINMGKKVGDYTAVQVKAIKSRITAAWKAKIDADGPPEAEKFEAAMGLAKGYVYVPQPDGTSRYLSVGLAAVAQFAYMVESIWSAAEACRLEQEYEGDTTSQLPARLEALAVEAGEILCEMAEEETQEESGADVAMKAKRAEAVAAMRKALTRGKTGLLDHLLAKAGARHSKDDMGRLQKAHDHLSDMGAACKGAAANNELAEKAARGPICKALKLAEDAPTEVLDKALAATIEKAAKWDKLPADPKGVRLAAAVTKGQETGGADTQISPELEKLMSDAEKGDTVAQMKLVHRFGRQVTPPSASRS